MPWILGSAISFMAVIVWLGSVFLVGFGAWLLLKSPKLTSEKWRNRAIRWVGVFAIASGLLVLAMNMGLIK